MQIEKKSKQGKGNPRLTHNKIHESAKEPDSIGILLCVGRGLFGVHQSLDWLCYFISQGVHKICMLTNHDFGFTARLTPLPAITLDNKKQAARSGNLFVKVMEGV